MTKGTAYKIAKSLRTAGAQVADGAGDGDAERQAHAACDALAALIEDWWNGDPKHVVQTLEKHLEEIADLLGLDTGPTKH